MKKDGKFRVSDWGSKATPREQFEREHKHSHYQIPIYSSFSHYTNFVTVMIIIKNY